ncbi:PD-(D/E)XK nuclease family protein [Thermoleptolyngbya sp. PKUAC-SCTB121]|nr:PD-(D/E)XK nuclease family protein [Thermoleptolyngbya sp. PKUAC-SCTB121]
MTNGVYKNSVVMKRARRGYLVDAAGRSLPSVSTILNATKPPEAREALAKWRDRLGAEEAGRIATAASRRGSQTHAHIRRYLAGEHPTCPDAVRPYWESLEPIVAEIQNVRLLEAPVFHYDLGYAGKVDCVASYRGVPCVLDWKTGDRPKGSIERLYDGPLQLAAYCGAVNHYCEAEKIHIREAMLVVAIPHQPAEVFWFEPGAIAQYWGQWQRRVGEYYRRMGSK